MGDIFVEDYTFLSDDELISHIRKGEYRYLEVLSARYKPMVLRLASDFVSNGFELDDLIQEGEIALFSAVQSYSVDKSSFRTFAQLCVSRAISSYVKSAAVAKRIPRGLIDPIEDTDFSDEASPESIVIEKEDYKDLTNRIKLTLSELEYKVLCEFLQGSSYADISRKVGISAKSVDNALRRVREKIK